MCLICGSSTRIGSEIGHPVNGLRPFGRSFPPQFIKQFCRISRNYRRFCRINGPAHGSACLAKSAMKQRLGRGSADIMPAANTDRVDESNCQERPPWGLPGSGWSASIGRVSGVSRPKSAPDHEIVGAVASSARPNIPSGCCTSYRSPGLRASGRLHLAGHRPPASYTNGASSTHPGGRSHSLPPGMPVRGPARPSDCA